MKRLVQPYSKDDADHGTIEYGVIAVAVALALLAILGQLAAL